jgi:hypothetical protein
VHAWALLPNHGHLLLRTGADPLATVMRRRGDRRHGDERILGESDFVEVAALQGGEVVVDRRDRLQRHGYEFAWLLRWVGSEASFPPLDLVTPNEVLGCVRPRRLLCDWAGRELGLPGTAVAARLHLTQSAVRHGDRLVREQGVAFPQGWSSILHDRPASSLRPTSRTSVVNSLDRGQ